MRLPAVVFSLAIVLALPAAAANITVKAPAAGAHWQIGSHQFITWTYSGIADSKKILINLFQNGTKIGTIVDQTNAGTNGQGSYEWPSGATIELAAPAGPGYSIRVKALDGSAVGDSGSFTLDPKPPLVINKTKLGPINPNPPVTVPNVKSIILTSPKAGFEVDPFNVINVFWTTLGSQDPNVSIALMRNGSAVATVSSTPNDGSYPWDMKTVSPAPDPGLYTVRVRTLDGTVEGVSPEFTMKEVGVITLVSPTGGEVWESGMAHAVKWTRTGNIQSLTLYLNRNGNSYQTLAQGLDAKLLTKNITFVKMGQTEASSTCYGLLLKPSGNNTMSQSGCITLTGNPDLVAVDAHISPPFIGVGTDVTFTVTVKNQGLIESHPCQGNLKFNGAVKSTFAIPNIGVGQSIPVDVHWTYTGPGTITITVDSSNNNVEPDKTNNVWTKNI